MYSSPKRVSVESNSLQDFPPRFLSVEYLSGGQSEHTVSMALAPHRRPFTDGQPQREVDISAVPARQPSLFGAPRSPSLFGAPRSPSLFGRARAPCLSATSFCAWSRRYRGTQHDRARYTLGIFRYSRFVSFCPLFVNYPALLTSLSLYFCRT